MKKNKRRHRVAGVGISEDAKTGAVGVFFLASVAVLFLVYGKK